MATKSFAVNTEPHVAVIGDAELRFLPEVDGAEYAEAFAALSTVQKKIKVAGKSPGKGVPLADLDTSVLVEINQAMRSFVKSFLEAESQAVFETLRVPERVLVDMTKWVSELYGGTSGKKNAPGGPSNASST